MRLDERTRVDRVLQAARVAAYPPGEYVEQESFMRASEIRSLARRAGVAPGVSVLDLCCGVGGPGRFITAELGCSYLGIDRHQSAIELARDRARAAGLSCRFVVGEVPPVPSGSYDVVLLLETLLAFPDKKVLLQQVSDALVSGGRFAFTVEEGWPLTASEQEAMPGSDTVWPIPLTELVARLSGAGLEVDWIRECSRSHRSVVDALVSSFVTERPTIEAELGEGALDDLLAAHRLWRDWLATGRVRKYAIVAVRAEGPHALGERQGRWLRSNR
jgi:sarcosine/dimethylglycine N-methyltransferase